MRGRGAAAVEDDRLPDRAGPQDVFVEQARAGVALDRDAGGEKVVFPVADRGQDEQPRLSQERAGDRAALGHGAGEKTDDDHAGEIGRRLDTSGEAALERHHPRGPGLAHHVLQSGGQIALRQATELPGRGPHQLLEPPRKRAQALEADAVADLGHALIGLDQPSLGAFDAQQSQEKPRRNSDQVAERAVEMKGTDEGHVGHVLEGDFRFEVLGHGNDHPADHPAMCFFGVFETRVGSAEHVVFTSAENQRARIPEALAVNGTGFIVGNMLGKG